MSIFAVLQWPEGAVKALKLFIPWYFVRKPKGIIKSYMGHAHAMLEIFSIWFMVKTLFKPWKNIVESYPKSFLQLDAVLQAFFLNLTTRCVGALLRIIMIVIGILMQVVTLAWFSVYLGMWFTFPFIMLILAAA